MTIEIHVFKHEAEPTKRSPLLDMETASLRIAAANLRMLADELDPPAAAEAPASTTPVAEQASGRKRRRDAGQPRGSRGSAPTDYGGAVVVSTVFDPAADESALVKLAQSGPFA